MMESKTLQLTNGYCSALFILLGNKIINTTTCIMTRNRTHQYWCVGFDLKKHYNNIETNQSCVNLIKSKHEKNYCENLHRSNDWKLYSTSFIHNTSFSTIMERLSSCSEVRIKACPKTVSTTL